MTKALFLYATREGQTRRICECMAEEFRSGCEEIWVRAMSDPDIREVLAQSDCLVMGASIHYGHFPKEFYRFISENRQLIELRPNAFFGVNLTARKPGKDTPQGSVYMRKFLKKSPWQPQNLAVFAGALRYSRYTWYDRAMIRFIMWITGGPTDPSKDVEFTDWTRVASVAREWLKELEAHNVRIGRAWAQD